MPRLPEFSTVFCWELFFARWLSRSETWARGLQRNDSWSLVGAWAVFRFAGKARVLVARGWRLPSSAILHGINHAGL